MNRMAIATTLLLAVVGGSAEAGQVRHRHASDSQTCLVEVLYSEMLPIGPLFYHTVKVTFLVTPPHAAPFETVVHEVISWQAPPPRQGQRVRVRCNPEAMRSPLGFF